MARFDFLYVDRIEFKLVLAGHWARDEYMRQVFFSKNCINTETHPFTDFYAIRILNEGNNSLPALL